VDDLGGQPGCARRPGHRRAGDRGAAQRAGRRPPLRPVGGRDGPRARSAERRRALAVPAGCRVRAGRAGCAGPGGRWRRDRLRDRLLHRDPGRGPGGDGRAGPALGAGGPVLDRGDHRARAGGAGPVRRRAGRAGGGGAAGAPARPRPGAGRTGALGVVRLRGRAGDGGQGLAGTAARRRAPARPSRTGPARRRAAGRRRRAGGRAGRDGRPGRRRHVHRGPAGPWAPAGGGGCPAVRGGSRRRGRSGGGLRPGLGAVLLGGGPDGRVRLLGRRGRGDRRGRAVVLVAAARGRGR